MNHLLRRLLKLYHHLPPQVQRPVREFGGSYLFRNLSDKMYPDEVTYDLEGYTPSFMIRSPSEAEFVKSGIRREETVIKDILQNIQTNDVVYDVGSNFGMYTYYLDQAVADGQVIAFEPDPDNFDKLAANREINDSSVDLWNVALGNEWGTSQLVSKGKKTHLGDSQNTTQVKLRTGDELVRTGEIPLPNIIKIDVEGAELDVIRGLEDVLNQNECRLLYCETHPTSALEWGLSDHQIEELRERLQSAGFETECLQSDSDSGIFFLRARK